MSTTPQQTQKQAQNGLSSKQSNFIGAVMLRGRCTLCYRACDEVCFSHADLPRDDLEGARVTPADILRAAVRRWAKEKGEYLLDFRSPRKLPLQVLETVAQCGKRESCEVYFRFRGKAEEVQYHLAVYQSHERATTPRKPEWPKRTQESQPSVEERMAILAVCERLSEQGVAVIPGGADQLLTRFVIRCNSIYFVQRLLIIEGA